MPNPSSAKDSNVNVFVNKLLIPKINLLLSAVYVLSIKSSDDTFAFSIDGAATGMLGAPRINLSQSFESIQVGLLPKINIGAFSVGIGGGLKIPMASSVNLKYGDTDAGTVKLNMNDIATMYSTALIGYIKGTFDYSIFFTDKIAMNIGLYLGYDFMPKIATDGSMSGSYFLDGGTFDIGLQLGLKFGPKA